MIVRHPTLLVLGLLIAGRPALVAQWSVAVEATASYYGGTSRDSGADPTAFRPHHPTSVGLRVDRRFGGLGLGGGAAPGGAGRGAREERRQGELPPGFERRAMWRGSVSLGLRYRL